MGFSHCEKFANRIYNYSINRPIDPTLNKTYAIELRLMCPIDVDPRIAIDLDPTTPKIFDNVYFKNLQQGKGLFSSDQVLYTDFRSRPAVNLWASNREAFERAFIIAITKLGRTRVKTGRNRNGNIRHDCSVFNWTQNKNKSKTLLDIVRYAHCTWLLRITSSNKMRANIYVYIPDEMWFYFHIVS